jgi:SAM-dependent methyltransferase
LNEGLRDAGENGGVERLIGDEVLERSSVVANRAMNRERRLAGRDGYSRVLGVDIVELLTDGSRTVRWLDLCCGSGKAPLEAAAILPGLEVTGVDLVDFFAGPAPASVTFHTASITTWEPAQAFDLITCVHGLHYVGDKLAVLTRAASWLTPGGLFVANFDATSVRLPGGVPAGRRLTTALRQAGFTYDGRTRRIRRTGHASVRLPFRYLGADDHAGPNYTGQPAVHSHYEH